MAVDAPKPFYVYGRLDGEEMGEWLFGSEESAEGAKGLAADEALLWWETTGGTLGMVVWLATPVAVGRPRIEPGEDLGDGDREPDEWVGMMWEEDIDGR